MLDMTVSFSQIPLAEQEFFTIAHYIQENIGVKMPDHKQSMVESRLQKRLKALNLTSFKAYLDFVFKENQKSEILEMIHALTTHETSFFRENYHYEYLNEEILPKYINNRFNVLFAGVSTGQELYSTAIQIEEFTKRLSAYIGYKLTGIDISAKVLSKAHHGSYSERETSQLEAPILEKYFKPIKIKEKEHHRIIQPIRDRCNFQVQNLISGEFHDNEQYDLIFCRNTLIYFERQNQVDVISRLCRNLKPGGIYFMGHSESIIGMDLPLRKISHGIYERV